MDGMLMEWEKMLPDPDELADLDHPDMIDSDFPIFGGKNQSPGVVDTSNTDELRTGKVTPNGFKTGEISSKFKTGEGNQQELNTREDTPDELNISDIQGKGEVTTSLGFEQEQTVKLIDELNSDKNYDNTVENSFSVSSNDFENCTDSPLQISDVRTGDIPTEKEMEIKKGDELIGKSLFIDELTLRALKQTLAAKNKARDETVEKNQNSDGKTVVTVHKDKTEDFKKETEKTLQITDIQHGQQEKLSENKAEINTQVNYKLAADKTQSSSDEEKRIKLFKKIKEDLKASQFDESVTVKGSSMMEKDEINDSRREETAVLLNHYKVAGESNVEHEEREVTPQNHDNILESSNTDNSNDKMSVDPLDEKNNNENNFITLAVKEEPMDYEEYGKALGFGTNQEHDENPQEFITNYYSNMDGDSNPDVPEINYSPPVDYKMTDSGLYQCIYCSARMSGYKQFQNHLMERHQSMYQCKHCDKSFYRSQELAIHCRIYHCIEKEKSQKINKNFGKVIIKGKDKIFIKRKKAKVYYDDDGNQIYKCAYCGKSFLIQQAMASHVRNVHHNNFNTKDKVRDKKKVKDWKVKIAGKESTQNLKQLPKIETDLEKPGESENDEDTSKSTKSREFSRPALPYRNMSFESDSNQIEESLANSECSLKRELKSNQIYHCSKCTKWFYREKQVQKHEETCTGIKQEPIWYDESQQDTVVHDGIENKSCSRQEYLKKQKDIREKKDVENKIQSEIMRKLRQKMMAKKSSTGSYSHKMGDSGYIGKIKRKMIQRNFLPKFFCKYCPSSFEDGEAMNLHLIKHLGEVLRKGDQYKCRICKKYFHNGKMILFHLQNHTAFDVRNMYKQPSIPECYICGQPFVNLLLLKKHQNKHGRLDNSVSKTSQKTDVTAIIQAGLISSSISNTNTGSSASQIMGNNCDIKGNNSDDIMAAKQQIGTIGCISSPGDGSSAVLVGTNTVSLADIPYQCGMCLSRFPNSQFLLHHITLHMQGPYVFKIEVDKKDKEAGESSEKKMSASPENISFSGKCAVSGKIQDVGNLKAVSSLNTGDKSQAALVLNMPDLKRLHAENSSRLNPSSGIATGTELCTSVDSVVQDHMYTSSLLQPQVKDQSSVNTENSKNQTDDKSETESAVSSEEESSAYYDSDECEEIENNVLHEQKCLSVKRKHSVKRNAYTSHRVPNFKKCFDIASGDWFECPYCLHLCETPADLACHMKNHNQSSVIKKMVQCYVCGRKFLSKWHLSKHMEHSHRQNSYKCSFCDEGFLTSFQVIKHVQNAHH